MDATELFTKEGKPAGVWHCATCNYVKRTEHEANECCKQYVCRVCGVNTEKFYTKCDGCAASERHRLYHDRLDAATLVADDGNLVFTEQVHNYQDGYFPSMSELLDCCVDQDDPDFEWPEFAFACKSRVLSVCLEDVLSHLEDGYEDMLDNLSGIKELKVALNQFNALNEQTLTVWDMDYTRKVAVPPRERETNETPATTPVTDSVTDTSNDNPSPV